MRYPRRIRLRSALPGLAALALVGLVLAGCGSSDSASAVAGAAGTDGRAATAFPASTAAFLDANIDENSTAWKQLLAVGARFPSWPKFAGEIQKGMNDEAGGDTFTAAQLRSWLGPEVAIGVLDVPTDGRDPSVLAFAEVRNSAALEAAVKKDKDTKVLGKSGDFDLFGDNRGATLAISSDTALISNTRAVVEAAIARLGGSGDDLAGVSAFQDTMSKLATDNILVGYAPGSTLPKLIDVGRKNDRHRALAGRLVRAARQADRPARRRAQRRLLLRCNRERRARTRDDAPRRRREEPPGAVRAEPARPRARQLVARRVVR